MVFCIGDDKCEGKGPGYQKNYHAWNKPVSRERYNAILKVVRESGLKFDGRKTWANNWKDVTEETWKKLSQIPEFDLEVTKKLSGIEIPLYTTSPQYEAAIAKQGVYHASFCDNIYSLPLTRMIIDQGIQELKYTPFPISSPSPFMSIVNFVREKTLPKSEKVLRKAGFRDSCGHWTSDALDALEEMLADERSEDLVKLAEEILAEQEKKKS